MPQNATAQKAKDDLTPTQSIVIEALIGRVTVTDAATAGGIDRTTVHRLLRNDFVFQAAYNQARLELHEATMTRLLKLSKAATCTVEHAIQNGDVGTAVEQGGFQFLDEQALAADLGQRTVENLVAPGGHAEQHDFAGRIEGFEPRLDVLGLPQGETALTGGNDDTLGGGDGGLGRTHDGRLTQADAEKRTGGGGACCMAACGKPPMAPAPEAILA